MLVGGADMPYPPATKDLHHEMELVVAIGTGGRDIAESDALTHVWGYCAGLDITLRDLQNAAKKTASKTAKKAPAKKTAAKKSATKKTAAKKTAKKAASKSA